MAIFKYCQKGHQVKGHTLTIKHCHGGGSTFMVVAPPKEDAAAMYPVAKSLRQVPGGRYTYSQANHPHIYHFIHTQQFPTTKF